MGLNMDVDHVAFAGLRKFDGRRTRSLYSQEIGQIAGRAGRFRRDGAFGVTGDTPDVDPEVVAAVEGHVFPAVQGAEWRNPDLDFSSLQSLMRSLGAPPPIHGLRLSEEAQDEVTLRQLSVEELIVRRTRDRANLQASVGGLPDPRLPQDHAGGTHPADRRSVRAPDPGRPARAGRLDAGPVLGARPHRWRHRRAAGRLARVRTLAYIANRSNWLADPAGWQGRARALEDRLSDTLHQSLMQRFVDRRTSTLLRSLHQRAGPILGGIAADGEVTVEGHVVGRLTGVHFEPARADTALEARALRGAVERAVGPEVARRLGELASETDEAFSLGEDGVVAWRGMAAGEIAGGAPFKPRVRLIGEFGDDARASARRVGSKLLSPRRRAAAWRR